MAATNIDSAIQSLTAFVQYVSPTNTSPADTNRPPFNVLDYGTAATQISAAATNLNALIASVNGSLPQMQELSQQTRADAEAVVRHAFVYGLVLVMILLAGAVLAGLTYRFLANKLPKSNDPK
jgi:methyl-accepting chemotaxis protein